MKRNFWVNLLRALLMCGTLCAVLLPGGTRAATTDISPAPLGTRAGDNVAPNLMFILDDSGSMDRNYMPDQANDAICKQCPGGTCTLVGAGCEAGTPPFYAAQFNTVYYNPAITYNPGVDYLNISLGNQPVTAARNNPYATGAGTIDLTARYTDIYWCTFSFTVSATPTAGELAQLNDPSICRRNGVNTGNPFAYTLTSGLPDATFRNRVVFTYAGPHYYTITPREHCTDETLITCTMSTTPTTVAGVVYNFPAPVRWCRTTAAVESAGAVSGGSPRLCQALVDGTYSRARFGTFTRVDINAATSYPRATTRTDCTGAVGPTGCTGAQELQNFANWYSYYRTRLLMMKTVPGRVFANLGNDPNAGALRAGFVTINASDNTRYLRVADFKNNTHRQDWFNKLYGITASSGTPLREALSRVGRHYAGITSGINSFMPDDPMIASCQRNYALLTTDGYWNGNAGQNLTGGSIGNQDNVANTSAPVYVDRATTGTLDAVNTLTAASTPTTRIDEQVLIGTASSTFPAVNGVTSGANQAGVCPAGQAQIKRRTTTFNAIQNFVDGAAGSTSTSSTTYSFTNVGGCANVTTTTVEQIRETQEWESINESNLPQTSAFPPAANGNNAQTLFTCTVGTGIRTLILRKILTYTRTSVSVNGGAPTTTFSAATSGPTFAVINPCNNNNKTAAATQFTVLSTNITTTGLPVAAPTTTTTGTTTIADTTPTPPGAGAGNTLADVAMYYYKTDLRTSGAFAKNNVPVSGRYIAPHQHMVTFTMGLGLDGLMTYRDDYETATSGDFFKIKAGVTGCLWTTGTCNWPVPVGDTPTAIDDLWHAAVNGRGKYFSAKAPASAEAAIKDTFAAINIATGSAAAAATSTPNLTTTNNTLYSAAYRTVKWDGEIRAFSIDPATGVLNLTPIWTSSAQLNSTTTATADSRTIYTFDASNAATKRKLFLYGNLTASEQAFFNNKCIVANWSQCATIALDTTRLAAANTGANLVNYLRGQRGNELSADVSTGLFRARENLLGDTVNAKPAFMGPPELQYQDAVTPDYSTFRTAQANRTKVLFVASNDGMLHAFDATNGAELWAYIPKMVMPNLFRLANASYGTNHAYFVDGSPTLADVFVGGAWKSVLVGGLNSGGRGYYALDVTDPSNPKALWEICSDAALCAISDNDLGLSFGQPVITKRPTDGKWVVLVTSGYNNVGPGSGGGYLYVLDLATGAVLDKVGTTVSGVNAGDTTTPNGFAKISGFVTNAVVDNTTTYVYGGDLLGNVWRFDMSVSPPTVQRLAQLKDGSTPARPQSITTRPELTRFDAGFTAVYVGTGRFLGDSDLPDGATLTPPVPYAYQQSVYGFKDTGADLGNLRLPAANLVSQSISVVDAATRSISNNPVNWSTNNGWFVDLNPVCVFTGCSPSGESPGERVNIDVALVRGTLVVIANEPNSESCSSGGDSFLYQFSYKSGSFVPGTSGDVVGTKIGNVLAVGITPVQLTTGQISSIVTTAPGGLEKQQIRTEGGGGSMTRAAWRELLDTRTSTDPNETP